MKSALMLHLTELRGIPASGKTTFARSIVHKTFNTVRVNRDDLRTMLFGNDYELRHEKAVVATEVAVVSACAKVGYNVVVDDTNLASGSLWRDIAEGLGMDHSQVLLNVPTEVAIARDAVREERVGEVAIRTAAQRLAQK